MKPAYPMIAKAIKNNEDTSGLCTVRELDDTENVTMEDNTGNGTVKDFARAILEYGELTNYAAEIVMDIGGKKVNMEASITYVDGKKYGNPCFKLSLIDKFLLFVKRKW